MARGPEPHRSRDPRDGQLPSGEQCDGAIDPRAHDELVGGTPVLRWKRRAKWYGLM
jgi:hypothetical protein